ncbi:WD40 repeat domain-containing protein [Leptolyngbya sp. FACHB-321]|uniref:WD40 repeat domain-containing protein n=1 Tax=Leptolyngbya sp. FACHB-321 TaxID=2692807 RepID=UPI0016845E1E|nr:WD40 repeat domain-containing protein [Leptolyngbya sp. FACHB-321]MBD2034038.1 WD40 repeat domain-containing protein [Leptolyngbya sp. FACHB-321]
MITALLSLTFRATAVAQTSSQSPCPQFASPQPTNFRPRLVQELAEHTSFVYSLTFSCDGRTLISTSSTIDKSVKLWDWRSGKQQLSFTASNPNDWFTSAFLSPDGQTLVTADSKGEIQLREPQTGAVRSLFPARTRGVGIVVLTRDGQTLVDATGRGGDFSITLWNFTTQQQQQRLSGSWADVWTITPDGYILAAASNSGTARVWNLRNGQLVSTLPISATAGAMAIALTPNAESLIVTYTDGSIKQWNARTGRFNRLLFRGIQPKAIAMSPDGRTLAIGYYNHVRLWDLNTNRLFHNLPANASGPQLLRFSPDGRFFLNTDEEGNVIRVWQLTP